MEESKHIARRANEQRKTCNNASRAESSLQQKHGGLAGSRTSKTDLANDTRWKRWQSEARRHVPVHSSNQRQHAANRARGYGGENIGVGKGNAAGTREALLQHRSLTLQCSTIGCSRLQDFQWHSRHGIDMPCSVCRSVAGAGRKRCVQQQQAMAQQLLDGRRILVEQRPNGVYVLPMAAAREASRRASK